MRWWMLLVVGGCWAQDELVHDAFTPEQWTTLQQRMRLPSAPDPCDVQGPVDDCDAAGRLGQALFFDRDLSGTGTIACADCHDPNHDFADHTNVSSTATAGKFTKRNAVSLVNSAYKSVLSSHDVFTWSGGYATPGAVVDLAIKPMASTPEHVVSTVRASRFYRELFSTAFPMNLLTDDEAAYARIKVAFDVYIRQLVRPDAPFDAFLADAGEMPENAVRGFAVFAGRGMCMECHAGPLFTDLSFRVTGVAQIGEHVPLEDHGRSIATGNDADDGKFITPTLRDVTETAPYMHQGWFNSLGEVIEHYRRGGDVAGFAGVKDPMMFPAEISDEDARDLVAFLGQLTGRPLAPTLLEPFPTDVCKAADGEPGRKCSGRCVDLASDRDNCSTCGFVCAGGLTCRAGMCAP